MTGQALINKIAVFIIIIVGLTFTPFLKVISSANSYDYESLSALEAIEEINAEGGLYCDDINCAVRGVFFVANMGRTPVTGSEIYYVYDLSSDEELFHSEPLEQHKIKYETVDGIPDMVIFWIGSKDKVSIAGTAWR